MRLEDIIRTFSLLLIFVLCTPLWAGEMVVSPELFNRYKPSYIDDDGRGNIWVAYYDMNNGIHISNLNKGIDLIVNEGREKFASGIAFDVQGERAFVAWREKVGGNKKIFFRATHDGGKSLSEPILLDNNTTGALARIVVGSNNKGDVYVVWEGEEQKGSSSYFIYSVHSGDFGRSFSEVKNLTYDYHRTIYPTLLVDGKWGYNFSYSMKDRVRYMVFRKSQGKGEWSKPVVIKEIGTVTIFIKPIKVGERLHVFWFNSYEGVPVIEGAYSDDGGRTWKTAVFEDTRGLDIGFLNVGHDSMGHIYLVFSGKWETAQKNRVYLKRSEDNGTTWKKMIPLRHYPFDNTHATSPAVQARDNGEVAVIWVDYRNIRSNIYMQYSKDYGKTWQERDIPLEEPGRYNTNHYAYTKSLITSGDRYYLLTYRFRNDLTLGAADLLLIDFRLDGRD